MLVIIKSAPDTIDGKRGVKIANETASEIILLQNGVYFAQGDTLRDLGFSKRAYALEEDMRLRGLKGDGLDERIKKVDYDGIVDLMVESEKVVGMF